MTTRRGRVAPFLLAPFLLGATPSQETFREAVDVREAEVVVSLPEKLRYEKDAALRPADFLIRANGAPRPALEIQPLSAAAAPWRIVVALDPELAHPNALFASALTLAADAGPLAATGRIDLLDFDPAGRWIARDLATEASIANALAERAGAARTDPRRSTTRGTLEGQRAARRLDELVRVLLEEPASGPRLVIVPIDPIVPGDEGILEPAARLLAAYGWVVAPMTLADVATFDLDAPGVSAYDHWNEGSLVGPGLDLNAILRWLRGKRLQAPKQVKATIEAEVLPGLGGARRLAATTAGVAIDREAQIEPALAALRERFRLTFEPPDGSAGALYPLEVGSVRGGGDAVAPRFGRAGASPELADLLLRGTLAGAPGRRELAARATRGTSEDGDAIEIEIRAPGKDDDPLGPIRVSWAYEPAAEETTAPSALSHHEILEPPAPGAAPLRRSLALPAGATGRPVAVLIQRVRGEAAWSARLEPERL